MGQWIDRIRILDVDGSVTAQQGLLSAIEASKISLDIINLLPYREKIRHWASRRSLEAVGRLIPPSPTPCLTFIGSGDYHQLSSCLTRSITVPFSMVMWDNHPDWDGRPPRGGCGSWVNLALENPCLRKFVILGPSSDDLSGWNLWFANRKAVKDNRIVIHPFRVVPHCAPFSWEVLDKMHLHAFLEKLFKQLPTQAVYTTIDKDCLRREEAITNWDNGLLTVSDLVQAVQILGREHSFLGADICGDYSSPYVHHPLRRLYMAWDRPKGLAKPADAFEATRVNERTNIQLLNAFVKGQ